MWQCFGRHACKKDQRALDGRRPLLFRGGLRFRKRGTARVVDQYVYTAVALDCGCDQLAYRVVLVEIARESEQIGAGLAADLLRGCIRTAALSRH
jgi:hypothetical protein